MPGNARGPAAGLSLPRGLLSQQEKPLSRRGRAVTIKERVVRAFEVTSTSCEKKVGKEVS